MAVRGVVLVPVVALGFVAGGLWWWAVLRLVLVPQQAGLVEGAVAAGGWGLSLLPVHVTASRGGTRGGITRASRRRRSGGGSGPS
ncbi:hypothetical protein [Streptomyces sp. V1I1]|uniref:hypothetical protein n=1 Tax=Streptomyces sp. V1I1 TaxID=3042272 RepID=UPI002783F981|nr:hypothetical protein [Streptomyces sp. V1I1]MDQ0940301.1 putative membrane protein YqiK [Streptomyces sp. V1I1]